MISPEDRAAASTSLLLQALPSEYVEPLLKEASVRHYDRGETVFLHGETAEAIHVVLEGWTKLYRISPNGNEAVVSVFTKGHSFGEAVVFRATHYPVSCEAVTECRLLQIPARSLVAQLRDEPEMSFAILGAIFQHLHDLVGQIEQIKARPGAQRLAEFLLNLCQNNSGACVVTLPYDKALIAGRLGMKPESLSRAFSRLQSVGVRTSKNHAEIDDIAALQDYVERDPAAAWNKSL